MVLEQVSQQSSTLQQELMGNEWLLEDLGGRGVIDNLQTTIQFFEEGRLGGRGGCNRYFADYEITDNTIKVGVVGSTFMACAEAVMNQESKFLEALAQATEIRLEGPFLFIECENLDQPLKFTRLC